MNEVFMGYDEKALLDPDEYLELRKNNPRLIKEAKLIPPRIGLDKHLGKIFVTYSYGQYGTMR